MNSTYTLNEGDEALNRVLLMMRYDLGKTLSENIVLEQPDSRFETQYNKELMKKYDKPAKTMTLDEFMEDYRETLSHPVMIGLETFLLSTGVGGLGVSAAYAILLIYDIYKGITTGDWGWFEIVFNILAIISAGALTKILRPYVNSLRKLKFNSLDSVFTYLSKTKLWPKIKGFLQSGLNILTKLSESIGDIFKWISEKTGFEFAKNIPSKVQGFLKTIINGIGKMVTEPLSVVGKKQAITRGVVVGSLSKAVDYLSKYSDVEIPKWNNNNLDKNKWSTFIIANNPKIYGKNIKYSEKIGEILFSFLRDVNGNFYIYDTDTKKWVKQTDPNTKEEIHKMFFINNAYSKEKLSDFEVNDSDKKRPIFTINGVDYKFADNNYRLKKI